MPQGGVHSLCHALVGFPGQGRIGSTLTGVLAHQKQKSAQEAKAKKSKCPTATRCGKYKRMAAQTPRDCQHLLSLGLGPEPTASQHHQTRRKKPPPLALNPFLRHSRRPTRTRRASLPPPQLGTHHHNHRTTDKGWLWRALATRYVHAKIM